MKAQGGKVLQKVIVQKQSKGVGSGVVSARQKKHSIDFITVEQQFGKPQFSVAAQDFHSVPSSKEAPFATGYAEI